MRTFLKPRSSKKWRSSAFKMRFLPPTLMPRRRVTNLKSPFPLEHNNVYADQYNIPVVRITHRSKGGDNPAVMGLFAKTYIELATLNGRLILIRISPDEPDRKSSKNVKNGEPTSALAALIRKIFDTILYA